MDRLVQINMKYLPINQTIMNDDHKYSFFHFSMNNRKFSLVKYYAVDLCYNEHIFILLFNKYFNDDVTINWLD